MEFSISCSTFARLARIGASSPMLGDGSKPHYHSFYYEVKNGHAVAIGTNCKIAAIEYLGKDIGPDFSVNICVHPDLIKQCETEKSFGSTLNFVYNDMLQYLSAKTTLGYVFPENALFTFKQESVFKTWRKWFPEKEPTENKGQMFAQLDRLAMLASSAPSGAVMFPEIIDISIPVVLRDQSDPAWIGLFIPTNETGKVQNFPLPKWVK